MLGFLVEESKTKEDYRLIISQQQEQAALDQAKAQASQEDYRLIISQQQEQAALDQMKAEAFIDALKEELRIATEK